MIYYSMAGMGDSMLVVSKQATLESILETTTIPYSSKGLPDSLHLLAERSVRWLFVWIELLCVYLSLIHI